MTAYSLSPFAVQVAGVGISLGFSEVLCLTSLADGFKSSSEANRTCKEIQMPVNMRLGHVILKRGISLNIYELQAWFARDSIKGTAKKNITLSLVSEKRECIAIWHMENAYPVRVEPVHLLTVKGNKAAIEILELAHEGIKIERPRKALPF